MRDDDALDLSAWEPPALPADFVDDVIARARDATSVGAATALVYDHDAPATRRWWPIAEVAVASAAAGAIVTLAVSGRGERGEVARAPEPIVIRPAPEPSSPLPQPQPSPPSPSPAIVPDGLTAADIDRAIRNHASAVRECYARGLATRADLGGRLVVAFDVDGDGRVHDAAIASRTGVWDAGVPACVVHVVSQLPFPAKGGSAHVVFPFLLETDVAIAPTRVVIDRPDEPSPPRSEHATSAVPPEETVDCDPLHHMHALPAACSKGWLRVDTQPAARVFIDGADTGVTTPGALAISPGRHKVTFVVGEDRYTYPVTIAGGRTETMVKTLD